MQSVPQMQDALRHFSAPPRYYGLFASDARTRFVLDLAALLQHLPHGAGGAVSRRHAVHGDAPPRSTGWDSSAACAWLIAFRAGLPELLRNLRDLFNLQLSAHVMPTSSPSRCSCTSGGSLRFSVMPRSRSRGRWSRRAAVAVRGAGGDRAAAGAELLGAEVDAPAADYPQPALAVGGFRARAWSAGSRSASRQRGLARASARSDPAARQPVGDRGNAGRRNRDGRIAQYNSAGALQGAELARRGARLL